MKPIVCYGGLGNRINEIINGHLGFLDDRAPIHWHVNEHLPFEWNQLFTSCLGHPIKNVYKEDPEFVEPFWGNLYEDGDYCSYWYPANCSMGKLITREQLQLGYSRLMNSLKAQADARCFNFAVHFRGMGTASCELDEFIEKTIELARELNIKSDIFVLADTGRIKIIQGLEQFGFSCVSAMSDEMLSDKDREDLGQVRLFMSDYLTLNSCHQIITSSSQSTITDPARAFGAKVWHAGPLRVDPACWFVQNNPQSFLQL